MFHIVEFISNNEIAVVPESWLRDCRTVCFWPPYRCGHKITKSVESAEDPRENWEVYSVRCLSRSGVPYEIAKMKCEKTEAAADLEESNNCSETAGHQSGCKRRRRNFILPDSDSNCLDIPYLTDGIAFVNALNTLAAGPTDGSNTSRTPDSGFCATPTISSVLGSSTNQSAESEHTGMTAGEKLLYAKLERMTKQLDTNTRLLNRLITARNAINVDPTDHFSVLDDFPMSTEDELLSLEMQLVDNEEKLKYIQTLGRIGGTTMENTTRRILQTLFSKNLAIKYSWAGRMGKKAFKDLKLKEVVFGAVRQNPKTQSATDEAMESVIKAWLRCALDRDGGRRARAKRRHLLMFCKEAK